MAKGRLQWLCISAPWSRASATWSRMVLRAPEIEALRASFDFREIRREDFPEWDQAAQILLQTLGDEGGWPLNLFCLPDGRVFFGATAFDAPSLDRLLRQMLVAWEVEPASLEGQARESIGAWCERDPLIQEPRLPQGTDDGLDEALLDGLLTPLAQSLDPSTGLFGAGGFLYPSVYSALLGRTSTLRTAHVALETLGRSPACDVLGGGFFRALDTVKLATENAEMLEVVARVAKKTRSGFLEYLRSETLRALREDFRTQGGDLASALTESPETYRFSSVDLLESLSGSERTIAQRLLGLSLDGRVPVLKSDVARIAVEIGEAPADVQNAAASVRGKLLRARARRELPENSRVQALPPAEVSTYALLRVFLDFDAQDADFERATALAHRVLHDGYAPASARARFEAARALLAAAKRRFEKSNEGSAFLAAADRLLGGIESYVPDVRVELPFLGGRRFDACDSHGRSAVALRLDAWMDRFEVAGARKEAELLNSIEAHLPWQLRHALELARPLGLHAAGIYAAFVRYLA